MARLRIVFWGKGERGVQCLQALQSHGYPIPLVVTHPAHELPGRNEVAAVAKDFGIPVIAPEDPNQEEGAKALRATGADVFVLAGYGKILKRPILELASRMGLNLHAGKLPKYRGSSPMNWALINGETSFTLTIIKLNEQVDGGDILLERTFEIGSDDTIRDLHRIANQELPRMLLDALRQIEAGTDGLTPQDESQAAYYPLRFPDDGVILWDLVTAQEAHNRIRALTEPYPCAFTFWHGRKVKLLASKLVGRDHFGEPGRIYQKSPHGLLVCAQDRCLWVTGAVLDETGEPLSAVIQRYDRLATVREWASSAANEVVG